MKHFQDDGLYDPEELYDPTIKHFKEGNNPEPDYDTSMFSHSDDDDRMFDGESTIHHFQD